MYVITVRLFADNWIHNSFVLQCRGSVAIHIYTFVRVYAIHILYVYHAVYMVCTCAFRNHTTLVQLWTHSMNVFAIQCVEMFAVSFPYATKGFSRFQSVSMCMCFVFCICCFSSSSFYFVCFFRLFSFVFLFVWSVCTYHTCTLYTCYIFSISSVLCDKSMSSDRFIAKYRRSE